MADKVYTTTRQQLRILRSRGMVIPNGSRAIKILDKENYYSVINGYKDPFILKGATPETYLPNTQFDELYAVFCFDRNIRQIYLKYILKAEHQIKSTIAHEFSKLYGHDNYLKLDNFKVSNSNDIKQVLKTIEQIQRALSNQMDKSNEITHYMSQYGYVPLWVLVNILTLGDMCYFYSNMKPHDKNEVARKFSVQPDELTKYIKNLTLARNLCAHDERFYDFRYKSSLAVSYIPKFSVFSIPSSNGNYMYGTKDAFSIAVILSLLLSKTDIREFISAMDKEFKKLDKSLHTIASTQIMERMGFGSNWKNLTQL